MKHLIEPTALGPLGGGREGFHQRIDQTRLNRLSAADRKSIRRRIVNGPQISSRFELGRLRERASDLDGKIARAQGVDQVRLRVMRCDCEKAIATLALIPNV